MVTCGDTRIFEGSVPTTLYVTSSRNQLLREGTSSREQQKSQRSQYNTIVIPKSETERERECQITLSLSLRIERFPQSMRFCTILFYFFASRYVTHTQTKRVYVVVVVWCFAAAAATPPVCAGISRAFWVVPPGRRVRERIIEWNTHEYGAPRALFSSGESQKGQQEAHLRATERETRMEFERGAYLPSRLSLSLSPNIFTHHTHRTQLALECVVHYNI